MVDFDLEQIVARLRRQGTDDSEVEVKECAASLSKDIWETVSAFANTSGGLIILGVSERNGFAPVADFDINRVREQFVAGMGDGGSRGKLVNPPRYSISRAFLDSCPVLVIEIEELPPESKPCYLLDRGPRASYKRVDDKDILLSDNELFSVAIASERTAFDRSPVACAVPSDLDDGLVQGAFARALSLTPRALKGAGDGATKLKRLNFTNEDGSVTKAGLLVAGVYPQQFYPRLVVDVAVHAGTEKGASGALRFRDRTICEGTLGEMVVDAVAAAAKNLRRRSVVVGTGRVDELEIPEEVIREAVANALIHRDYNPRYDGQAVSVDIYDDRIEILNPGGLCGTKTQLNLADGSSCCRNATLMRLMSLVPLPEGAGSPAEGNGSGIPMMLRECRERGLPEPEFCPRLDSFKVILYRPVDSGTSDRRMSSRLQLTAAPGGDCVLEIIGDRGEMSASDLVRETGLSMNQVRYRIKPLLEAGLIEATAPKTSRLRKYRLAQRR